MVGMLLMAMIAGGAVAFSLVVMGQPLWAVILSYMLTGTTVLLLELLVTAAIGRAKVGALLPITARFRAPRLRQ